MSRHQQPWSCGQEALLVANAHLGAQGVVDAIEEAYGIRRTIKSVQQRAYCMHVSLYMRAVCPGCGRTFRPRDFTNHGLCRECNWKRLTLGETPEHTKSTITSIDAGSSSARKAYDRERQARMEKKRSQKQSVNTKGARDE